MLERVGSRPRSSASDASSTRVTIRGDVREGSRSFGASFEQFSEALVFEFAVLMGSEAEVLGGSEFIVVPCIGILGRLVLLGVIGP